MWEFESCDRCGNTFRSIWETTSMQWKAVTGNKNGGGCYCFDCFIKKAEIKGIKIFPQEIKIKPFQPKLLEEKWW